MKRRAIIMGAFGIAVLTTVAVWFVRTGGLGKRRRGNRPNILLITLDTTRADHLSCYGYERQTSPRIDEIAANGLVYDRCISPSSWTLPAHASLLTGRYPTSHGAIYDSTGKALIKGLIPGERMSYKDSAPKQLETLASVLKHEGYATGAVIGGPWLKRPFGIDKGFEFYEDSNVSKLNGRIAAHVNQQVLPWLEKTADRPFLLFINYFDPHGPYLPPKDYRFKFLESATPADYSKTTMKQRLALYDAEIYYMDHFLGQVVDRLKDLGVYDDTWIIITADHGELLGEHGLEGHGVTLYEPELHIPLILKYPKRWARQGRSSEPIRLIDLMPIVLHRLGIDLPDNMQGTPSDKPQRTLFAEIYPSPKTSKLGQYRAYYDGPYKYIWNSRGAHRLFDLKADPGEMRNLARWELDRTAAMRKKIDTLIAALPLPTQLADVPQPDEETMEVLRGLGYLGGRARADDDTSTSPARK